MALKTATRTKAVKKPAAAAKKPARKVVAKGQTLECEVCGMQVVIEQVGDVAVEQDQLILCCDEPMKGTAPKAKAKTTKK